MRVTTRPILVSGASLEAAARHTPGVRIVLAFVAGGLSLAALLLSALWLFPVTQTWTTLGAMAASFVGYLVYLWLAAALFWLGALWGRRVGWLPVVGCVVLGALTIQYAPSAYYTDPPSGELGVVALNTEFGRADVEQLTAYVTNADPDVVVLLEFTPALAASLTELGWDERFGYRLGEASSDAAGSMVYSRYPMVEIDRGDTIFTNLLVRVATPNGDYCVLAAHPVAPTFAGVDTWVAEGAQVRRLAAQATGPTVAIGDFNAVPQHYTMDELRKLGYRSAAQLSSAPGGPTWPLETWFPPLLTIDHAMVASTDVYSFETFKIQGTDHAGLAIEVGPNVG